MTAMNLDFKVESEVFNVSFREITAPEVSEVVWFDLERFIIGSVALQSGWGGRLFSQDSSQRKRQHLQQRQMQSE